MVYIKTKEGASLWIALLATAIVAGTMTLLDAVWWVTLCVCGAVFVVVALVALFIIRKYVAYKLKPIYSIVLSRDVHTHEIFSELKDKHVENIGEELTAWADTNDKEIARLKETEQFRKQYLGNVAHELKTPIFNIQGYISTLLDGGLEDELKLFTHPELGDFTLQQMYWYSAPRNGSRLLVYLPVDEAGERAMAWLAAQGK